MTNLKNACTASDPAQHLDLQQLAGFTSNLLQSLKTCFGEFRELTRLFTLIGAVDGADLCYIPDVFLRDFELQAADMVASDMLVNKFKSPKNMIWKDLHDSKHSWRANTSGQK
ncbi:general transcription factor ii-i repeat domain-containing 2-like protein [Plakobranchus ocellatus]|uniref:General transcription factor ii-i repeat domain-containing 2-like protein n=1 Tax=Plakobranchus ocellatus TaxID=259542 RepID=A0AAV4CBQ3_9GAST|nr:general transcription factor ii-i repeat domain-containing 2-like protein [Plakobranchus ocellatus]